MTSEQPTIDKSDWGEGPWQQEPDRVEFQHAGLPCLMVRHPRHGNWCGYAAVPPGHPLHGKPYQDVDLEAHGGLTYSDHCQGDICHTPAPGEPDDVYWFGFDCGHAMDLCPGHARYGATFHWETYRPLGYVRSQVRKLARQLANLAGGAR
jgi:hypothetical protein